MAIQQKEIQTIAQFLSHKRLRIPHFQRPYKWTAKNVIQLIDDVTRFQGTNPYRIGTIVIYQDGKGNYQIVDGQQRSISFVLITKAIQNKSFHTLTSDTLKQTIQSLNAFQPTFKNEVSIKNIQDNYREIERKIDRVNEAFIDYFYNKCEVTFIVIDDVSEAFQFFDSQNARGKDLEPHDLLKAYHLREINNAADKPDEKEVSRLVDTWEGMETKVLSGLFAEFLYRVRGWSKGLSSRMFTKKDTPLFKGINLEKTGEYPFARIYKMAEDRLRSTSEYGTIVYFPFQLDQVIINGAHFFEMVTHYKNLYDQFKKEANDLSAEARQIIDTLNNYPGKNRTGDKYVRMLFDCAVLYYLDKFGDEDLSRAIEKIFIWAYTLRLRYQNLLFASVDNYVIQESNLFRVIRDATYKDEVINYAIPVLTETKESDKTIEIKVLFTKMHYYAGTEG